MGEGGVLPHKLGGGGGGDPIGGGVHLKSGGPIDWGGAHRLGGTL